MTAQKRKIRLEAPGIWQEEAGTPPRAVMVSFGNATLIMKDPAGRPLGHWALAGTRSVGQAENGATIFAISPESAETLSLADAEMIAAIAAVSRDYPMLSADPESARPRRFPLGALALIGLLAAGLLYGPDLLRDQAAHMVPPGQAREFGARMLTRLIEEHGPLCADPAGTRALADLARGAGAAEPAHVLDLGGATPVAVLPGPLLLIDSAALATLGSPDEIAGWAGFALERDPETAALRVMMAGAGPLASLRYILTGRLNDAAIARAAEAALAPPPGAEGFIPLAQASPALSDQDWKALRAICP